MLKARSLRLMPIQRMRPEPAEYFVGALIGREDRVEDMLDAPIPNDEREALQEPRALRLEGRQAQGIAKLELRIAQHGEGKVQAFAHLLLVGGGLRAQAENLGLQLGKLGMVVAKAARLRRTAARARDHVPALGKRFS